MMKTIISKNAEEEEGPSTSHGGQEKRRRMSKSCDRAPVPVKDLEINEPLRTDTSSQLLSPCAPVLEPLAEKNSVQGVDSNGAVEPSETKCPGSSKASREKPKSPPSKAMECVMSEASSSKVGESPTNPGSEPLRLRIETRICEQFSILQMNTNLYLEVAAKRVDSAVLDSDIGVVELGLGDSQKGWIWANGLVMIMSGGSEEVVAKALSDVATKTMGKGNLRIDPSQKIHHLRLCSCANFPWSVNLQEFCNAHVLPSEPLLPETSYVYYVDKEMPGVSARLYYTGMIHVLAMTTAEADKMLTKLYLLSASYGEPLINQKSK